MSTWYRSIDTEGIDGEGYHYGVISLDVGNHIRIDDRLRAAIFYGSYVVTRIRSYQDRSV